MKLFFDNKKYAKIREGRKKDDRQTDKERYRELARDKKDREINQAYYSERNYFQKIRPVN